MSPLFTPPPGHLDPGEPIQVANLTAVLADDQLIERIAAGEDADADDVQKMLTAWVADVRPEAVQL
jgi:hypothetical protein